MKSKILHVGWAAVAAIMASLLVSGYLKGQLHAEGRSCPVPKNYGTVKAAMGSSIVLEAADGTIRVVDVRSCNLGTTLVRE